MTYLFLHLIIHLLFLSPDWLTFYHMIISHINSLVFLFIFCFSLTKGNAQNVRLYYPYRQYTDLSIYFDLYLYSAYAAHYVYCIQWRVLSSLTYMCKVSTLSICYLKRYSSFCGFYLVSGSNWRHTLLIFIFQKPEYLWNEIRYWETQDAILSHFENILK